MMIMIEESDRNACRVSRRTEPERPGILLKVTF
jgi:hypothetical protein